MIEYQHNTWLLQDRNAARCLNICSFSTTVNYFHVIWQAWRVQKQSFVMYSKTGPKFCVRFSAVFSGILYWLYKIFFQYHYSLKYNKRKQNNKRHATGVHKEKIAKCGWEDICGFNHSVRLKYQYILKIGIWGW